MSHHRPVVWAFALLILATALLITKEPPAHGQTDDVTARTPLALPFTWQGAAEIDAAELTTAMPPFVLERAEGDFRLSQVDTAEGATIRLLNSGQSAASPAGTRLHFSWSVPPEELESWADQVVVLSWEAHAYSPPAGVRVYLSVGERGESSSVAVNTTTWQPYRLARRLTGPVDRLVIGVDWQPTEESSWLEFRTMQVELRPVGSYTAELAPIDTPTATPFVVTSTPTPASVFAAATQSAAATARAGGGETNRPTPANMVTATLTPTPTETATPIVLTATPTPANGATATAQALYATAVAFTTGAPTPYPPAARVIITTPIATVAAGKPTATPTPLFVYLDALTATPAPTATPLFPAALDGKILFKAALSGNDRRPDYLMMNADGSGVALLTGGAFYLRAEAHDSWSPDGLRKALALREQVQDQRGKIQIFVENSEYDTLKPVTFFGAGTAWAPVWSPDGAAIAFVSNESQNDEIWLVTPGEWPARQLTKNTWEWDHHPSFSPDGRQIIFSSNRGGGTRQLWIMDADGGNQQQLTTFPFEAWDPVWVKGTNDDAE